MVRHVEIGANASAITITTIFTILAAAIGAISSAVVDAIPRAILVDNILRKLCKHLSFGRT